MDERLTVRVDLWDGSCDGLDMTVPEAVKFLQRMEASIPPEHRETSRFIAEHETGWYPGDASMTLRAYYERPETDEEMAARLKQVAASQAAARAANEANEKRIYEMLKQKFG